ncbi:hypothetical protein QJQ45_023916, partial [Haematococcus lacustris]
DCPVTPPTLHPTVRSPHGRGVDASCQADNSRPKACRSLCRPSHATPAQEGLPPVGLAQRLQPCNCLAHFEMGRVIGSGSFGRVHIVRHLATGGIYVIKTISKAACIKEGHDARCLYLIMDYVAGGDMFAFLRDLPKRIGRTMPEEHARFYAAQLLLALEHLHQSGIAYRDLKVRPCKVRHWESRATGLQSPPTHAYRLTFLENSACKPVLLCVQPENLLMGMDGYLQLADFGFAKAVGHNGSTRSFCGTPDYLAPEVVLQQVRQEFPSPN